jgi:hypothetical protein
LTVHGRQLSWRRGIVGGDTTTALNLAISFDGFTLFQDGTA